MSNHAKFHKLTASRLTAISTAFSAAALFYVFCSIPLSVLVASVFLVLLVYFFSGFGSFLTRLFYLLNL
jgi:hypothetical protein